MLSFTYIFILSFAEIKQIKDIIKKTNDYSVHNVVIQFQIYTGMRIGETLALTWDDIDFKNL